MTIESRKLQLALLQIEQYDTRRYLNKIKGKISLDLIKRVKWTCRLRMVGVLSMILGVVGANIVIARIMRVVEWFIWLWVKRRISILQAHGLRVVAIAGSYGKTSVKHNIREILRTKYRVVETPESYNTIVGIARCLYWEVDFRTDIYLVEIGAYKRGDIAHILAMVNPDVGVLTGIAKQHLERFGSYENIKQAKGEIVEYMLKMRKPLVANRSNAAVKEVVDKIGGQISTYGGVDRNEINLNGARMVAKIIGMKASLINKVRVRKIKNRFEMTTDRYGIRVIDNAYNSNEVSFRDSVNYLGKQSQYTRILVTPGLVELGVESVSIHEKLGRQIVGNVDLVILVGKSERVNSIERGIAGRVKVVRVNKTMEFVQFVKKLKLKKEPLVILENDVTENYND